LVNESNRCFIGTGRSNAINNALTSAILAGDDNTVDDASDCVIITGGANKINKAGLGGALQNCLIGCGSANEITGLTRYNCVLAGDTNKISGTSVVTHNSSVIIGGLGNSITTSDTSTILGGSVCSLTNTSHTIVGGKGATSAHIGCFVFSDTSVGPGGMASSVNNQFRVGCAGGVEFFSNAARTTGVTLGPGLGAWAAISDRNKKENIVELDYKEVLEKVNQLPIYQYNYKDTSPGLVCRGPVAQEWHALFPSEKDPLKIDTMDLDGITLASLKGLLSLVSQQQVEIDQLKQWVQNH
jgi:hypothetical protein